MKQRNVCNITHTLQVVPVNDFLFYILICIPSLYYYTYSLQHFLSCPGFFHPFRFKRFFFFTIILNMMLSLNIFSVSRWREELWYRNHTKDDNEIFFSDRHFHWFSWKWNNMYSRSSVSSKKRHVHASSVPVNTRIPVRRAARSLDICYNMRSRPTRALPSV